MPANLNALIRYKTIDKCLSNPYRKWTIADLIGACSATLKESRGIESGVSERTIREDIRVMRSDILGFNAPIVQHDGNYSYENPSYSIFHVSIKEKELLKRVLNFILELQVEIDHPRIEEIIDTITNGLSTQDAGDIKSRKQISQETNILLESDAYLDSDLSQPSAVDDALINEKIEFTINTDYQWSGILNLLG